MAKEPNETKKSGPTATPAATQRAVSKEFIETLRSLHVSKRVLEAAEKAVEEREATGDSEPVSARP
jgi:archaellum component FlaD/FlaE